MKHLSIFLVSLSLLIAALPAAAGDKVEICHFSPGGAASKAITVSEEAAVRHIQEHGDHVGACLVGATPLSKVYLTDFSTNDLFVFNGDSNTQLDTLKMQKTPVRAVASPNGEFVYVTNYNSNSVSVVSTSDDSIVDVLEVGRGPVNVVFSSDSAIAYVYNIGASSVSVVRTGDLTVVDTIAVGRGDVFTMFNNLAISPNDEFVYVPNTLDNTVSVIETATNQVRVTVPVGQAPLSVAVTPDSQYVYVVNASDPVFVIQTSDHTVIKKVGKASNASQGLAITPDGQFVYIFGNSQFVQVISTATISVVASIELDQVNFGTDIVIDPNSNYVYMPGAETGIGNGALYVIETASRSVVARVPIGGTPKYAAISPDGAKVYIANFLTLDIVQTSDNSLVAKVNTGGNNAYSVAVVEIP